MSQTKPRYDTGIIVNPEAMRRWEYVALRDAIDDLTGHLQPDAGLVTLRDIGRLRADASQIVAAIERLAEACYAVKSAEVARQGMLRDLGTSYGEDNE